MDICPHCNGEGKVNVYTCPGFNRTKIDCSTCQGTGEADLSAIEKGLKMKQDRIKRRVTLLEEAKRLGISASHLSALEHGRKFKK